MGNIEHCGDDMCWAGPLSQACDHWQTRTLALENHGIELAAKLGEAEHQLAGAVEALQAIAADPQIGGTGHPADVHARNALEALGINPG